MTKASPSQRLSQLITGISRGQAIFAAAELGIADLIAGGETSLMGLATATDTHPPALRRFLRFLISIGLFDEAEGKYDLTDLGQLLRSDVAGSKRPLARMLGRFAPAWAEILHSIKTPETGFTKAYGKPLFQHLRDKPEDGAIFDSVMEVMFWSETTAMLAAIDLKEIGSIADIGGGNGSLLIEVLNQYPNLRGILFDLPHVVDRARSNMAKIGLAERCSILGGDFFKAVPGGADAYLLRHVIHNWDDPEAVVILNNCRQGLPPQGRVLVVEMIVPEGNDPSLAKDFDLSMLVLAGGMERTEGEYRKLFEKAGLELTGITPTAEEISVIEGRAAA